jgi:multidrug resistance protein, MATE family
MEIQSLLAYLKLPNQYDFVPHFLRLSTANILSNMVVLLARTISIAFLGHLSEIRYFTEVTLATILFDHNQMIPAI